MRRRSRDPLSERRTRLRGTLEKRSIVRSIAAEIAASVAELDGVDVSGASESTTTSASPGGDRAIPSAPGGDRALLGEWRAGPRHARPAQGRVGTSADARGKHEVPPASRRRAGRLFLPLSSNGVGGQA
jgi:hypothetical protein